MNAAASVQHPGEPVTIAVIGAGVRSSQIYAPLYPSLTPWVKVTAVCDPVKEHADRLAAELGVRAYYNIRDLVKDRPMEAALVITPVESHHSISVYLSSHGIHNMTETSWCNLLAQAKEMSEVARRNRVIVRVAENFFRFPIDRFAQVVRDSGVIGRIGRIFSYADHTGYHNNSRWIVFAGAHPDWVQSIEHTMPTAKFRSTKERFHERETFHARYFHFPNDFMVIDQAANGKGFLGRLSRPGHTEWQGEKGTLVSTATNPSFGKVTVYKDGGVHTETHSWTRASELRVCSDESLADVEPFRPAGHADQLSPVVDEFVDRTWIRTYAETAQGVLEYVNPYRPKQRSIHIWDEYGSSIMAHIADFALAIRGLRPSEFDERDAMMSLMMEIGARESVLREGRRIPLPLEGDLESEERIRRSIQKKLGVDPLDVEAMLGISYPKP